MTAKDSSISLLRMLAMISIVSCHVCQFYGLAAAWWLNIGVQVFLVISGYIFGLRPIPGMPVRWFAKRFRRIYVPYFFALVLLIMMNLAFMGVVPGKHELLAALCLRSGSVPNGTHLWYVSVILLCYLITPVLGWAEKKTSVWLLLPLAIVASVVGWLLVPSGLWVCVYVLGFAMGRFVLRGAGDLTVMRCGGFLAGGGCSCLWFYAPRNRCLGIGLIMLAILGGTFLEVFLFSASFVY